METVLLIWVLFGIVTAVVASNKGRNGCGWLILGVLLGPFGLILSLVVPKNQPTLEKAAIDSGGMKRCPYCAELIKAEAIKCRYCGSDIPRNDPGSGTPAGQAPTSQNPEGTPSGESRKPRI